MSYVLSSVMHVCFVFSLVSLLVLLLEFFFSLFCVFYVSYELNLVPCLLFEGHLKFLNSKFVNHHLGYSDICLI